MAKQLRHIRRKVTFTFPNGAAGAVLVKVQELNLEGELLWIHQRNGDNANNATAQLTLEDEDGFQFWDGTAKADKANFDHEFGVVIRRILAGKATLKCTISGDPGATGFTVTAVVHLFGRDG